MAATDSADVTAVLKELFPTGVPRDMWYAKNPFFAMIPKDTEASGEDIKIPLIYGNPKGRSALFASAQADIGPADYAAFKITTVDDYALAQITGKVIDQTRNDRGSFVRVVKREIEGALRQLRRSLAHALYRNGGGAVAQIDSTSTLASTTITVTEPRDLRFLEVGMYVQCSVDDGTGGAGVLNSGAKAKITALNRRTGTITLGSNWSTVFGGSLTTSSYVFVDGDYGVKLSGLEAWIPSTDPSSTAFFNLDRSVDVVKLGGVRVDATGLPLEEALIDSVEQCSNEGGEPDIAIVNPKQWANLAKALGSKAIYDKRMSDDGSVGFKSIKIATDAGDIDVVADPNCPTSRMFVLQLDTWTLYSMGDCPKVIDDDGLPYVRVSSADAIEMRGVYRAQLACEAPGWNANVQLA